MQNGFWKQNAIALIALIAAVAFGCLSMARQKQSKRIAFVDTARLMTGFKEANKVNKEIQAEDETWKKDLKAIDDSLKAFMDTMTVKYDRADLKTKKEMQEELEVKNQQRNNFERQQIKRMQDLTQKKMATVYDKINVLMKEYGNNHHYDIIFGTAAGSILYGESTSADITNEIIEEMNKRYE
jgi:Skp family chaperone for outer membrane proteins